MASEFLRLIRLQDSYRLLEANARLAEETRLPDAVARREVADERGAELVATANEILEMCGLDPVAEAVEALRIHVNAGPTWRSAK